MGRNAELAKNTVIIAIGKICTQFATFLLLPIYTRFLSTEEYGTIDLIILVTSLIAPIISLQLERSIFRFLIDAREKREQQDVVITTSLLMIAVMVLLSLTIIPAIHIFAGVQYLPYITALTILTITTNVLLQIPRGLGQTIHFSIASAIIGIISAVVGIIFTVGLRTGVEGILLANIIAHSIGAIYLLVSMNILKRVRYSKRNKSALKEMLKFSVPMIPSDIIYWVISVSDRILIVMILGSMANGIYAAATKIPTFIVAAYNIFNLSWIETVSAHIKDVDASEYLSKMIDKISLIACSACCLVTSIMPFVFNIAIGPDYKEAYQYISILNIGAFFNIIIGSFSAIYFGLKRTKDIAKSNIIAAMLNILINIALIKIIGIYAAAISTALAYLAVVIYRYIDIRKTTLIKLSGNSLILYGIIVGLNSIIYLFNNNYLNIANIILTTIIIIILNRKSIVETIKFPKKLKQRR